MVFLLFACTLLKRYCLRDNRNEPPNTELDRCWIPLKSAVSSEVRFRTLLPLDSDSRTDYEKDSGD